jgi:hypothetical protein
MGEHADLCLRFTGPIGLALFVRVRYHHYGRSETLGENNNAGISKD